MYASLLIPLVAGGLVLLHGQSCGQELGTMERAKEDPKLTQAWKELEGRWKLVGITERNTYVDHSDDQCGIVVARQSVENYSKDKQTNRGSESRFEIDPTLNPAHLDKISQPKGFKPSIRKAIYRINGDTLEIVYYHFNDTDRPTNFVCNIFDKKVPLKFEYKRVKEEKK